MTEDQTDSTAPDVPQDDEDDDPLLDEIMSDVRGFTEHLHLSDLDQTQSLEEVLRDTEYLDLGPAGGDEGVTNTSLNSTPSKTVQGLAIPAGGIDSDIGETLSVKSWGSRGGRSHTSSRSKGEERGSGDTEFGSIMRHVILKAVSSQMCSAAERVQAGSPTCMATTHLIAVGTQAGLVLVFDSSQVIKWFLGGRELGASHGAVSSLAFNSDSSRLLAGFARGQLVEFDINSGKVLRDLHDVHPLGSAVIHTKYSDDQNFAFFADSGGSVFELNMKRGLRGAGATARCIFSGSRGEVCSMEPLHVAAYPAHPLADRSILALATISKVIVITVRPKLKVLMTSSLTSSDQRTLPIICWQFVVIQNPSFNKVVDPVLTFARENTIHFYQVTVNLSDKIVFIPLQSITVKFSLLACQWLNTRCLGLLDNNEQFHLMDVRSKEQLELVDLSSVQLVYQTQFFKGAATGGNVSAAFSLAGEMAVYGSTAAFTNQLLLLGNKTYHVLMIRSWSERLEHLLKDNKYIPALQLGCEFFSDPGRGLVGLRGTKERKRNLISLKVVGILKKFLQLSMTKNFPTEGGMGTLTKYFNEIVPPCVSTCIRLGHLDLLYGQVWTTFQVDPFSCAVYLECLEPYILSDQLTEVPPPIVQEFVTHYHKRDKLEALEACVTHLSVMSLDIHQVMSLSQQNNLYDAIIYIYNNAMLDYITPTEKLLALLGTSLIGGQPLSPSQVKLGNKLLVYISCCLAGRAYPLGDIPRERVAQVKYDVFSTVTLLHSRQAGGEVVEPPYPHLHNLLQFDAHGFLNVLSIAFEEAEFNTEVGRCQKQRVVDILLEVMVKEDSPFTATQVGYLFTFLARQLSLGELSVSRDLFSKVLGVLTGEGEGGREERQQALLDMILAGGWQYFDLDVLHANCLRAGFFRVLEKFYERSGEYGKILGCYLEDGVRKMQVFHFLQTVFVDETYSAEVRRQIGDQLENQLNQLVDVDCRKTAGVVLNHLRTRVPAILEVLSEDRGVLFQFVGHLLDLQENSSNPSTPVRTVGEDEENYLSSHEIYEAYIELMCEFEPGQVCSFLKTRDSYSVDSVMEMVIKYEVLEARVFLLEKEGKVLEAFNILKTGLKEKMEKLLTDIEVGEDSSIKWTSLNTSLIVVVTFCQRVSSHLSLDEREGVWCPLLDCLVKPMSCLQTEVVIARWREMVRHVISSMLGYVGHARVVSAVLSDPGYSSGNWVELKQLLSELIDTFRYESQLLESSKTVIQEERADLVSQLVAKRSRGLAASSLVCQVCGAKLGSKERSIVFSCRHVFHAKCLDDVGGLTLSEVGEEVWWCTSCSGGKVVLAREEGVKRKGEQDPGASGGCSEDVVRAREFLKLYDRNDESSQLFEERSFIFSDKFHLRLKPVKS